MGRQKKIGKMHPITGATIYNDGTIDGDYYYVGEYKAYTGATGKKRIPHKMYLLHIHVAELFVPNPHKKPLVNHKNGRKYDARASNLEWVTHSENVKHAWATGLIPRNPRRFTDKQVRYIRRIKTHFRELARRYRVSEGVIQRIRKYKTYKNIN